VILSDRSIREALASGRIEIGSKFQGQRGPTPSRYWANFRTEA